MAGQDRSKDVVHQARLSLGKRLLRDEFLNGEIFYSVKELRVLAERWRVHYNTVRPHSSLGYRPPAPEAWLTNNVGCGEGKMLRALPLLHTPDGYLNSDIAALHYSSNGTKDRALQRGKRPA